MNALRLQSESHYSMKKKEKENESNLNKNEEGNNEEMSNKSFVYSKNLSAYVNSLPNSELTVTVWRNDFLLAVQNVKPSVTRSELDHYEALGREFSDFNI